MTHAPYAQLINVKRWADHGLYGERSPAISTGYRADDASIMLRILDHIHAVDRIFQHHLCGLPHTFKAARSETIPTLDALAKSAREVDDWYADYVAGLPQHDFEEPLEFVFTSGKPARMQTRRDSPARVHARDVSSRQRWCGSAIEGLTPSPDAVTDFLEQR